MRKKLKVLLLASSLFMLAGEMLTPVYAVFVEQIGGDILTAGTTYAVFMLTIGIAIFLVSRWEDHVKHLDRLVVASYGLSSLGFLGLFFVTSPLQLFAVQFMLGLAGAIGIPAYDAIYTRDLERRKLASGWGAWDAMYYITAGIAAVVGGAIANFLGFRALIAVMFAIALAGTAVSLVLLRMGRKQQPG